MKATLTLPAHAPRATRSAIERGAWRSFLAGMGALAIAFGLAIYSGVAAETGALWTSAAAGLGALALAGWTAVTTVPALARRTPLRWLAYQVDYRVTRQGVIYLAGVFAVALAALNTGNNLLFLIVGCMLAVILLSGILSRITLTGVEVDLQLPEHVFAERPAAALLELRNLKQTMPSFSLLVLGAPKPPGKTSVSSGSGGSAAGRMTGERGSGSGSGAVLRQPVYFPYIARHESLRQQVELTFPRRGVYRQEALALRTRFPFGFLEKTRTVPSAAEMIVYPPIEETDQFYEILPLISGELESFVKGRGHDLYAIREHAAGDSARFVDWKATARSGSLKVREFAREDERRVLLVLDAFPAPEPQDGVASVSPTTLSTASQKFDRAVDLCACLAWHFHELNSAVGFRCGSGEIPVAPSRENIYDVLHALARIEAHSPNSNVPATDDAMALLFPPAQNGPRAKSGAEFLGQVASDASVFKIVLTSQPRGSIPTALWTLSYLIFIDSL